MSNEDIWSGSFGDEYVVRCDKDYTPRRRFLGKIIKETQAKSVLEVGCGAGQNLDLISDFIPKKNIWGVDVNQKALDVCHIRKRAINVCNVSGFDLPFKDNYFDLVFTAGVLIHQKPQEVDSMIQEMIRVSGDFVLAMEYYNEFFVEIPYRNKEGSLFKGPYGELIANKYGLRLLEQGFIGKEEEWDDLTWWLFSKY